MATAKNALAKAVIEKLPTNFQDDILDTSMSNKRRYQIIENSDGTISLEDVSTYVKVGSEFGMEEVNATNGAVNALIDNTSNIDNTPDDQKSVLFAKNAEKATVAENVDNDFILINQQVLTFANKICTIKDDRITANSLADVYFTADSINVAENAVISVETYSGEIELIAGREPEGTIRASIHIRVVK